MTNHARNGRAREHRASQTFQHHGWHQIMRAAASKGSGDLLLAHPTHGGALVQVGGRSKALGPADRARFVEDAESCGLLALLAVYTPRLCVWRVTCEPPSRWEKFPL